MASTGLRYKGNVAIVTGGSKGIGEGVVRSFVREGARVCFCARGTEAGIKLQDELNQSGPGECFFIQCDVAQEADIKKVVDVTVEKYGAIDCLVNNAGQHPPRELVDDVSADHLRSLFNINVVSYVLFAKYSLPHLRKGKGNIINVTSLAASIGQPGAVPYVATKGAILSMTKAMAIDEARNHVRVNSISPGNVWTPMWDGFAKSGADPEAEREAGRKQQLIGRYGTLEEAGNLALYIASEATFTTGADFLMTGGAELSLGKKSELPEDQ